VPHECYRTDTQIGIQRKAESLKRFLEERVLN
jgi:hypothetical protein